MVDTHGDIQDKSEVAPDADDWFGLIREIIDDRGGVHVYYPNHRDQEEAADDIHLDADKTYFFEDFNSGDGLIFTQIDGEQYWLDPAEIIYVEKHY